MTVLLSDIVNTSLLNTTDTDSRVVLSNQSFTVLSTSTTGDDDVVDEDHFIFLMIAVGFAVVVVGTVCYYYYIRSLNDAHAHKDQIPLRNDDSQFSAAGI